MHVTHTHHTYTYAYTSWFTHTPLHIKHILTRSHKIFAPEPAFLSLTSTCYIPNMKALHLPVPEKKNFEVCLVCFYVQNCDP